MVENPELSACDPQALLDAAQAWIAPALRQAVHSLPTRINRLAEIHFGWRTATGKAVEEPAQGKALRPALVLHSCTALGGERVKALPSAVAVELVHNASLVQDDVLDGDRERRGRPALWDVCGVPAGVLTGDALLLLALETLLHAGDLDAARRLGRAMQQLFDGEYGDTLLDGRSLATAHEVNAMIEGKTAALIETSCALGAMAADAEALKVAHMAAFGFHLGMAFQMTDDLLGVWGDPVRTGKSADTDIRRRKKTTVLAAALDGIGAAPGQELAQLLAKQGELTDTEVSRIAQLMETVGARTRVSKAARHHVSIAKRRLEAALPTRQARNELEALAELIIKRDH
ncbi:polyprenyl synthetase family protein [Streptomyces sp. NPDC001817]|uniref:polyprenyl synthetase family protein n=1 Tax=Streptomyces sp. NPDC001817 TaxID=3154398 RepID=UPI0033304E0E